MQVSEQRATQAERTAREGVKTTVCLLFPRNSKEAMWPEWRKGVSVEVQGPRGDLHVGGAL